MPTCPKCKADVTHLNALCKETNKYEIHLEEHLFPDSGHTGLNWGRAEAMEGSATLTDFNCPECDHTIFSFKGEDSNWTVVEEFLKGSLILELLE